MPHTYPSPRTILSPLAVDLDGTLTRGDATLIMTQMLLRKEPWRAAQLLLWFLKGRPYLKRQLSKACAFDIHTLVYDRPLIAWLETLKNQGITLILITGSDQSIADAVADHLGIFDKAIGSDGVVNRTGREKVQWLDAQYVPGQYGYLGNSKTDLPVWAAAAQALAINTTESVWQRLKHSKPDALRLPPFQEEQP